MMALITALVLSASPPVLSADSAILVDLDSGAVLFEKKADAIHAIASISKLVAIQVVYKRSLKLNESTSIEKSDYVHTKGGSRSRLIKGHSYKNSDLLHAALLGSDNRAVVALGRSVGFDFSILPKVMTIEAKSLGLMHTHFDDPTGISHSNVSTAREVTSILESFMGYKELALISQKSEFITSALERSGIPLTYRSTNILTYDPKRKVLIGKTGFNSKAGWCLATGIQLKSGRRIGIVVLGSATKYGRFRDARRLEKWARSRRWVPSAVNPAGSARKTN